MEKVRGFLQGKKTYAVAVVLVLVAALRYFDVEVPGFDSASTAELLLSAAGLGSLRAAIAGK